jgi:hypothetical protein
MLPADLSPIILASPACTACRNCLAATSTFIKQATNGTQTTAAALTTSFSTYCAQNDLMKQTQLCSKVQADIAASSFGNLARRAAGLCFGLQLCDRKFGTACSTNVSVAGVAVPVTTASLDLCSGAHDFGHATFWLRGYTT